MHSNLGSEDGDSLGICAPSDRGLRKHDLPEPLQVRRIVAGPLGCFQGAIYFAYFLVQVVICGSLGFHRDYEELLEPC